MPRQIVAIVAGTCLPAVLLFLVCAIKGMRRFGALGLWLVGWGLVFAHMKQVFVMLHPPAAECRRVEGAASGKHPPRGKDPSTSTLTRLIRSRRTVYAFKPERAPRDALDRALNAARWAPNHRLTEPWRFYVLGPETAEAVCALNAQRVERKQGPKAAADKLARWRTMPGWAVVTCQNSPDPIQAREDYGACCCAVQNLMLCLWAEGIGSKWNTGGVIRDPGFYDLIWADPAVETVVALLWYGYPAEVPTTQRKALAEVCIDLP